MKFDAVVFLFGKELRGDLQLGIDLVNDRTRAAGALVVHGWNLLLASRLIVIFEDDDLRVLAAEFDD